MTLYHLMNKIINMENKDISQIVLEKIKESGIKPISRKVFNFKRVLFWSLAGFSVVIGIVSFSVVLSILFNNDWYLYNKLGPSFILKSLPYFWFLFLLIFTVLGEFYYRKTFLGYRHRMTTIIGVYIILTVLFGSVLYIFGIGETVEKSLLENVPIYHVVIFDRDELWTHPEFGLLSGNIIEINGNTIKIVDLNNNIWVIDAGSTSINQAQLKIGDSIKVIGEDNDTDDVFTANEIHIVKNGLNHNCCIVR